MRGYERRADTDLDTSVGASPARGLQHGLFLLLVVVAAISLAFALALWQLNAQVSRWWAVEVINEQREALLGQVKDLPYGTEELESEIIFNAFDDLSTATAALIRLDPTSNFGRDIAAATTRSKELFAEVDRLHQNATIELAGVDHALSDLYRDSTQWSRSVWTLSEDTQTQIVANSDLQNTLQHQQTALTKAHLQADSILRELEGMGALYAPSAPNAGSLGDIRGLLDRIPEPCVKNLPQNPDQFCAPSTQRLIASVEAVLQADPTELTNRLQSARWAIDGFTRAAETRYFEMSDTLQALHENLEKLQVYRDQINAFEGGLRRLNGVLNTLNSRVHDVAHFQGDDLKALDIQINGLMAQAELRATGIVKEFPDLGVTSQDIHTTFDQLRVRWKQARTALQSKKEKIDALTAEMTAMANHISSRTTEVRRSAGIWIDVFSSTTMGVLVAVAGLISAATWASYTYLTTPLMRATNTILALARSDEVSRVDLGQQVLGFRTLAFALEKLRLSNIERQELTAKTESQRRQIEANLKELEETTKEMERRATHDALTSLPNRRLADEFLNGLNRLARAGTLTDAEREFCLMHIDVDRFKEINDTLGHEAGDAILCHVARVLENLIGDGDLTFRIGGDEFLIARTRYTTEMATSDLAERIVSEMNKLVDFNGHACRIGASIGIAFGSDADFDARQTLINADLALYQAKNSGRNGFAYFSEDLQKQTFRRKELSDRILIAIENDEFIPFYQPQFYSHDLSLRGLETLCRWQHPELGILTPDYFLACADDLKVVGRIDQVLFRKAARDLQWLRQQGISVPKISFNVTADRLMHADLAEALVREITGDTRIAVELLESMSLDSLSESVRWALDALKEKGIGIEIDDFGSCRASIAGLIAVGPDAMKIDGAIVGPITESEQHLRLVRAIVDIGSALGIEVVAERVESEVHIEILRNFGCGVLQGFALAKPMSAQDLARFMEAGPLALSQVS